MTDPERRFADALAKARAEWAAADPAACAARAGCAAGDDGVVVPLLGAPHLVTHPDGEVRAEAGAAGSRRRRHPPAALPARRRRHAAGGRLERLPGVARRAVLRGVVRAPRRGAADARVRGVAGCARGLPCGGARPRRRRADAGRRVVPVRRPAARGASPSCCGPATTRSRGRPACSSTPARATTSPPRTSPASAASWRTGSSPRPAAEAASAAADRPLPRVVPP